MLHKRFWVLSALTMFYPILVLPSLTTVSLEDEETLTPQEQASSKLLVVAAQNDPKKIKRLLEKGAELHVATKLRKYIRGRLVPAGSTPLHIAALGGTLRMLEYCVQTVPELMLTIIAGGRLCMEQQGWGTSMLYVSCVLKEQISTKQQGQMEI